MKTYPRRKALLLGLPIVLLFGGAFIVRAAATQSQAVCSIATMAEEYGLLLQPETVATQAIIGDIAKSVARDEPGASIADQLDATIKSQTLPPVNGRQGLVVLLTGASDGGVGGPAGFQPGPMQAKCVLSIYDAKTGEFLLTLRDLQATAP